jgi:hypothetical protein
MMETAQNRRAANDVPGGDYMTVPIRRRGMRGWHRYPRDQAQVRSAVVESKRQANTIPTNQAAWSLASRS